MATWKDTIRLRGRPFDRVVEVIISAPDGMNVLNLQELAERALQSPFKQVTVGKVTVKVRAFSR
jgi:hypothetical protein